MKQMSLATTGFELKTKRTRKRVFLDEMNLVIPWSALLALLAPHAPQGKTGRPPFPTEVMLRIHLLQQFFVCAVELVDGAQTNFAGGAGMSAPAAWARALKQASLSPKTGELAANSTLVSPYEHSRISSRFGGGYADHP